MPELPEVEVVRRGLAAHVTGRTISAVRVHHPRAVRRHEAGPADLTARLLDARITGTGRRGKYLWLTLDDGDEPLGRRAEGGDEPLGRRAEGGDEPLGRRAEGGDEPLGRRAEGGDEPLGRRAEGGDEPLGRRAEGGDEPLGRRAEGGVALVVHLGMSGQMLLGEVPNANHLRIATLLDDGTDVPLPVAHLARDPLDPKFNRDGVVTLLRHKHSEIKRQLLDQTVVSGIGNIYADEALWRAKINGARLASSLTRAKLGELLDAAADVMSDALGQGGTSFDSLYVNVNGESGYFDRSLDAYGREGEPCRRCGAVMQREKFMNRSSFYCPKCQPRPRVRRS